MNLYAITAPLNAFISCAFITLFMKNLKLKPAVRCTAVYVIYLIFAFAMGAGGNGLLNIDFSTFNMVEYLYRAVAGLCVCLFLFFFYSRGEIAKKREAKKNSKKRAKED